MSLFADFDWFLFVCILVSFGLGNITGWIKGVKEGFEFAEDELDEAPDVLNVVFENFDDGTVVFNDLATGKFFVSGGSFAECSAFMKAKYVDTLIVFTPSAMVEKLYNKE